MLNGLNSQTIQMIDMNNQTNSCYATEPSPSSSVVTSSAGIDINGTALHIDISSQQLMMNETFQFYVRAIGSQRPMTVMTSTAKDYNGGIRGRQVFDGVVVFAIQQNQRTTDVFSATSTSH